MGRIIPAGTGIVQHTEDLVESLAEESGASSYELAETAPGASDESEKLEESVVLSTGGSGTETIE
jgi:hypothetical protein